MTILWKDELLNNNGFKIGVGEEMYFDTNILVSGNPGSGKTNLISLIQHQAFLQNSICYTTDFEKIDYLKLKNETDLIYDHEKLIKVLKSLCNEYEKRKKLFISAKTNNLKEYNKKINEKDKLKKIYLFVDDFTEILNIKNPNITIENKNKLKHEIQGLLKSISKLNNFGINLICGIQRIDIIPNDIKDEFQIIETKGQGKAYCTLSNKEIQTYYIN